MSAVFWHSEAVVLQSQIKIVHLYIQKIKKGSRKLYRIGGNK